MEIIRAATLTVSNLERSRDAYCQWMKYRTVEAGFVPEVLAKSWGAPKCARQPYTVLKPASNRDCYIRLIEQPAVPEYTPLTSYGWAAIEICNQDTLKVAELMAQSPFEIIGPPKQLDGMPAIFPMQVKGLDGEIVYLTEIRDNLPEYDLPRAQSLIDKLFILVMACSDMEATGEWIEKHLGVTKGRTLEIIYSMLNNAFDLPKDTKHALATLKHERDVFLEVDQLPDQACTRPQHKGFLPPCVAIGSFAHPAFDALVEVNKSNWITPPQTYDSVIYGGKRAGTINTPDGTLIEVIEE